MIHPSLKCLQLNLSLVEVRQACKRIPQLSLTLFTCGFNSNVVLSLLLWCESASLSLGIHLRFEGRFGFVGIAEFFTGSQTLACTTNSTKRTTTDCTFDKRLFETLDVLRAKHVLGATCNLFSGGIDSLLCGFGQTFRPCGRSSFFGDVLPHLWCGTRIFGHLLDDLHLAVATQITQQFAGDDSVQDRRQAASKRGNTRLHLVSFLVDALKHFGCVLCKRAKVHTTIHCAFTCDLTSLFSSSFCGGAASHRQRASRLRSLHCARSGKPTTHGSSAYTGDHCSQSGWAKFAQGFRNKLRSLIRAFNFSV